MAESVNNFVKTLGLDYKSVKKLDVENEKNPEIAAKYAALKNPGNEIVIKNDNTFYLVELQDSVNLNDISLRLPKNNKSIVAINFADTPGAGALYTPETLSGPTLYEKGKTIITTNRHDETKGIRIGNGYFKMELTDINGFSNKSKNDVALNITGRLKITTEDLTRYLNEEVVAKDSSLALQVTEKDDDWKLHIKLKPETRQEISNEIKGLSNGEEGSYRDKLGKKINLEEKIQKISDKMINGIEKRISVSLSKERIGSILTGAGDAKKQLPELLKQSGRKEFIEKFLKEESAEYETYIPDFVFRKVADIVAKKLDKYIDENYSKENINDSKMFVNDLKTTLGNALSDTELDSLNTVVKSTIKGNELEMNLFIKGAVSSDKGIPSYQAKKDSLSVQGSFDLTSKGKAEILNTVLNTDASIDTANINQATVVSLAESLGAKGEKINTELVQNKRKINLEADAEFQTVTDGFYNSFVNVQSFSENNFGTSLKSVNGYFDVDVNTPGTLKLKSNGKVTIDEATLLSNYKPAPDTSVEKFVLKKPAGSKESVTVDNLDMKVDNAGAILKAEGISTGVGLKLKKGNKDLSLDIKKVDLKNAEFKVDFHEDKGILVNASGNNLKLSGIKFLSGKNSLSVDQVSVLKGTGDVELSKGGGFNARGNGVKVDNLKVLGLTASVVTEGLATIHSAKEGIFISGPSFKGNIRYKDEKLDFACDKGNLQISPSGNKIIYKAGADSDGTLTLKSANRDISTRLILPKGSKAEVDLKNNTLVITGKDSKEIDARIMLTSFSGDPIGDFRINSAQPVSASLGKALELKANSPVNISGSFKTKGEDISFKGKFQGNIKYENNILIYSSKAANPESVEIEAKGKKFNIESANDAVLSVDLSGKQEPVRVKVGGATSPISLKFKVTDKATGKVNADLETKLLNQAELGITKLKDGENDSLSLNIIPPAADNLTGNPGINITGTVSTPAGTISINSLNISGITDKDNKPQASNLTISEKGLNFKEGELNVNGSLALAHPGEKPKNITFHGETVIKDASVDFSDKAVSVKSASYSGKVNELEVKAEAGFDSKTRQANYTSTVSNGNETVRMNGNIVLEENNDNILSFSGRTSLALSEGNSSPMYFIAGMKDVTVYKTDEKKIISGSVDVNSAKVIDKKIYADQDLTFSGNFSLDKTASGFVFNLTNADLSSRDSLKAVISQVSGVLKQPQVSAELAKKGIKTDDIDKLQKQLYKYLVAGDLKTTSDIKVNLSNDLQVKDLSFNTKVDSVGLNFPIIRHTKESGFSIEANEDENKYKLNNPVSIKGKIADTGNGKSLKGSINIDLQEIMPKLIDQQFNSPDSPLKGKVNIKLEGDQIKIFDAKGGFFSHISFGLKDLDVKVKSNKAEIKLNVNLLNALFDSVSFAFSDNVKLKREWQTLSQLMGNISPEKFLKSAPIIVDLPEVIEKYTSFQLDGAVQLINGQLEIPFKS